MVRRAAIIFLMMFVSVCEIYSQTDSAALQKRAGYLAKDVKHYIDKAVREKIVSRKKLDSLKVIISLPPENLMQKIEMYEQVIQTIYEDYEKEITQYQQLADNAMYSAERMLPSILQVPELTSFNKSLNDTREIISIMKEKISANALYYQDRNYIRVLRFLSVFTGGRVSRDNPYGGVYNPLRQPRVEPPRVPVPHSQQPSSIPYE